MTKLILVGGFLGAGKTTLLLHAARLLSARGLRTGLVTNDQGEELVDTAMAAQQRVPVVEVAGGCFCCRFPDLLEGLHHLQKSVQPDVILAEPVGSCTDLLATVVRPLLANHRDEFELAPLTILLDSNRSLAGYDASVGYLYQKQLAEAEIVGLTKMDLLAPQEAKAREEKFKKFYSPLPVLSLSAQNEASIQHWLDQVLAQTSQATRTLEIDYQHYAQAEAQLGWLNTRGTLRADTPFSAKNWMTHFLHFLDSALSNQRAAIAHVKLQVCSGDAVFKASLTQSGSEPGWDLLPADVRSEALSFILNARVNTTPEILEQTVRHLFAEVTPEPEFQYDFTHFESFSPLPPQPTHRMNYELRNTNYDSLP